MDEKGQLSVEVILFVAIILFIVLGVGVFVNEQSVKNSIATAVRFGAENGTTEMGISNPELYQLKSMVSKWMEPKRLLYIFRVK